MQIIFSSMTSIPRMSEHVSQRPTPGFSTKGAHSNRKPAEIIVSWFQHAKKEFVGQFQYIIIYLNQTEFLKMLIIHMTGTFNKVVTFVYVKVLIFSIIVISFVQKKKNSDSARLANRVLL